MALRAVVLAAGRGVRMGGRTPKALLPLGDHEPLLGYLMSGLRAAGIENLLVVTGWRHAEVQTFVADRWPGEPTFVRNARFASWGNFHSVRVALDQSPGAAVLVVNSDVVTVPQVLADVAHTPAEMVLAVQRRADLDAEDMRVELDGERVVAIGKGLALERSHGEFCGVSKIGPRVARAYTEIASELEWRAETGVYYEDVYARLLDHFYARWAPVEADEYAEVDEPSDREAAIAVLERHAALWDADAPAAAEAER